jgi:hypothetical protein
MIEDEFIKYLQLSDSFLDSFKEYLNNTGLKEKYG